MQEEQDENVDSQAVYLVRDRKRIHPDRIMVAPEVMAIQIPVTGHQCMAARVIMVEAVRTIHIH